MSLILVYQLETDGETYIATFDSPVGLQAFVRSLGLDHTDYALFRGEILKSFAGRMDLSRIAT